jgi:hypothetical protein
MKSNAQILIVGRDETLLRTRQLILGTYFQVETAGRISHAAGILSERRFDLVVLCYSLSEDECQQVAGMTEKQEPRPLILELSMLGRPCAGIGAHEELSSEDGPYALVEKAAEMLGVELKTIGRASRGSRRRQAAFRF